MTKLILRSLSFEKTEAVKYRRAGGNGLRTSFPSALFCFLSMTHAANIAKRAASARLTHMRTDDRIL